MTNFLIMIGLALLCALLLTASVVLARRKTRPTSTDEYYPDWDGDHEDGGTQW